jgi:hypothetical protein
MTPALESIVIKLVQGFGAAPPLISDIDLSMDDKFLYVACWGTGEMRQYDVTEPRKPPSLPAPFGSAASPGARPTRAARPSQAARK